VYVYRRISKSGDDVGNSGLGCVTEFTTSAQVYLDACERIKAEEVVACAAESYLDVLTGTSPEGWEGLNILDTVFVVFAHTVCVS